MLHEAGESYARAEAALRGEEEILREQLPVVTSVAMRLKGRLPANVGVDDLVQAGLIAVLRLLRRDAALLSRGTLVRKAVANAMVDEARRVSGVPARMLRAVAAAARAMRRVEARFGPGAGDEAIAAEMGVPVERYRAILADACATPGLLMSRADLDTVADDRGSDIDASEAIRSRLSGLVAELPERERLVLSLYYEQEMSMREVGIVLGISAGRVCQIHGGALLRLRTRLKRRPA